MTLYKEKLLALFVFTAAIMSLRCNSIAGIARTPVRLPLEAPSFASMEVTATRMEVTATRREGGTTGVISAHLLIGGHVMSHGRVQRGWALTQRGPFNSGEDRATSAATTSPVRRARGLCLVRYFPPVGSAWYFPPCHSDLCPFGAVPRGEKPRLLFVTFWPSLASW